MDFKYLSKYINKPVSTPNSPRAEQVQEIMILMGYDVLDKEKKEREFKKILGRTRHLSVEQIYLMIKEAKRAKETPHILFQYLLKKSHENIKRQRN